MNSIKFGIPISLSGRYRVQGTESFQGIELFVSDVNSQGGLLVPGLGKKVPVKLIHYDDESSVEKCRELTERLIVNDGVDILLGPYSSSLALAAAEVTEAHGKTLWNHGGATDEIEKRGFECVISSITPASSYMRGILRLIRNTDESARKVALLSARDSGFSQNIAAGARAQAKELGFGVRDYKFKSGERDLRVMIEEVKKYNPDLILGMGRAEDDISVAKQLEWQGIKPKSAGLVVASIKLFKETFGDYSEGFLSISQWERGVSVEPDIGPTSEEFSERFISTYGKEPDYVAAQGYHIGLIVKHCVLVSGTLDERALRDSAKREDFKTFYGRFKTDSSGNQRGHETVVVQWQQGKKVIVYPRQSMQAPLKYPL